MEQHKDFSEIHKQTLEKVEKYIKDKDKAPAGEYEKIHAAKDKWQTAWNEFLETLMVLEKLEI
ncbi:MAG: hypothetical protein JST81_11040 [Bacteroidetes bacterium]|jgi:Zn-dependent M32 family carboxypeptidase|nr:hypothetical protein [Bacteroidota bacterium]